jgi:hypothetical protein
MYQLLLNKEREGKNIGISEDMFTLNSDQQALVRKYMALPKVTSWVAQCISENTFNAEAKQAYRKLLEQYNVTTKEWQATAVDFYYQELQKVAQTRAIPTEIDMNRLNNIAEFLDCTPDMISIVNMDLLGEKYVKAVSEAMTPTGVIVEEYKDGLERLRNRLKLTEKDAQTLLGVSARVRLIPVVKDLVDIFKSDTAGTARKNKDMKDKSGDPISSQGNVLGFMETGAQKDGGGPNVFMREALNLVDFFSENYLSEGIDIESLEKLPVTAVGVVPEEDLLGTYKHYLLTTLAEADEGLRERYEDCERIFALVLGISPDSQKSVKTSLAYTAYKNMLKKILLYKESADAQDFSIFATFRERLGLDTETGEKVLSEATKGAVLEHAANIIRPKDSQITSETARKLRTQVRK